MLQKVREKNKHSERLCLSVLPYHKTDFPFKNITSEAVLLFLTSAPPFLITDTLLVHPVGQTPHLVCNHQLSKVSEELYSTDLCQWSCIWR